MTFNVVMCRSQYRCPVTPVPNPSLLLGWPCSPLAFPEASVSSGVQGSKNQWPDQRWQTIKEEELNVIHACANNWEQWQLGFIFIFLLVTTSVSNFLFRHCLWSVILSTVLNPSWKTTTPGWMLLNALLFQWLVMLAIIVIWCNLKW